MQRTLFFKCLILAVLGVLLTLPLGMIERTIGERSAYRDEAVRAIAANSAGRQLLTGPLLAIPVEEEYDEDVVGKDEDKVVRIVRRKRMRTVTVVPKKLHLDGALKAERRAYGIHSAAVYLLHAQLTGSFDPPGEADLPARGRNSVLTWGRPRLVLGIADVRGLAGEPKLRLGDVDLAVARGTQPTTLPAGFHGELAKPGLPTQALPFAIELDLVGTESFALVPLAGITTAELHGNWADPSFGGGFLPRDREVGKDGFRARWSVSALASNVQREALAGTPGQASGEPSTFSVRLIDPVDIYRQALRAVKYGALFVVVIFAAFFALEIIAALPIHPIQYLLVGLALALFFLLLLSLSEHVAFAWAYLAAALASIGLIVAYLTAVLRGWGRAAGVGGALLLLYGALFGVLQSEQNALLFGSLLLFAILATLMLGTRRVDWYRVGLPRAEART